LLSTIAANRALTSRTLPARTRLYCGAACAPCSLRPSANPQACPQTHQACSKSFAWDSAAQRCCRPDTSESCFSITHCGGQSLESAPCRAGASALLHSITPRRSLLFLPPVYRAGQYLYVGQISMQTTLEKGEVLSANQHITRLSVRNRPKRTPAGLTKFSVRLHQSQFDSRCPARHFLDGLVTGMLDIGKMRYAPLIENLATL